ncbi:MAG: hypothetical protein FWG68_06055 [Defluviitaleaceae bacterium]|nr:hypothetical protein [Defluviitaleaceae bacterium]
MNFYGGIVALAYIFMGRLPLQKRHPPTVGATVLGRPWSAYRQTGKLWGVGKIFAVLAFGG